MNFYTKASDSSAATEREKENLILSYEAACESIVLLRNDGVLPLRSKKVALFGPGATKTVKGGTGSGEVNERHAVTVLEGLLDRGYKITTGKWLTDYDLDFDKELIAYKKEKRKRVKIWRPSSIMNMMFDNFCFPVGRKITEDDVRESATDSCIYVLSRQAGEGGDRKLEEGDYYLTQAERNAISFCADHYAQFVLVLNSGAPIDTGFLNEISGINAVLYMCQLGSEGGHALADILDGTKTPCGKLADTWPKRYEDIPYAKDYSYLNGNLEQEDYREGVFVGYRYFDTFHVEPAYPFGFGLSYTNFEITPADIFVDGTNVYFNLNVSNTGTLYSGKEVVELYISAPFGSLSKEYQTLTAFEKTKILAPGEGQDLTLTVDFKSIASYRESDHCYVLENGDYIVRIGNSSRNTTPVCKIHLAREVVVSKHDGICSTQSPVNELTAPEQAVDTCIGDLKHLELDYTAFDTEVYTYLKPSVCGDERVEQLLRNMTVMDMVEVVVGIGMVGGMKRFDLPGSVGNTTSKFWDKGLANIALCDGPAGLRLQRCSTINKKGKTKPVEFAMSIFEAFPGFAKRILLGNPKKEKVVYQYTTAFPVEAALAQSWNTNLLTQIGFAIYSEMKEYGCTYWLAPAVNLHRNPLCGRHFEYFSEDPRLAGMMATAITRGVQQEPGFCVTIKHYACNNQEENRNQVSSNVSERTLRELYLKAFEIAVKEGDARGVMTSYNRVNGVYAPNSYDLCTKVLRCEWGFDGVVMTDWFSTARGRGSNAIAIKAGNDMIMPGSKYDKKEILKGLRNGVITEEDLRWCCANVIKAILDSETQREFLN